MYDLSSVAELRHDILREAGAAGARASPVGLVAAADVTARSQGLSLEQWVYIVTLVYLMLQIIYLIWKFRAEIRRGRVVATRRGRTPQDE